MCLEGTLYPSTSIKVKRLHPLHKSERDLRHMPKDPLPPVYFRFLITFVSCFRMGLITFALCFRMGKSL